MAGRGWQGGGRGRGGAKQHAPQLPFQHFPEDANLPDVKFDEIDAGMKNLLKWSYKFQNYFKASPYFLEETTSKVSGNKRARDMDIERYSDKKTMFTRDSLSQVLMFNQFPKELVQGASGRMPSRKKFRWNPELETKRLDILEQKEERSKGREDKDENRKKDGEDEDEDEDEDEEDDEDKENDDEEDFTDDDYNQNEHFDDDEDDYNDVDDYNDEPTYEVD